ncbi:MULTISPECIES: hypothetical protein [Lysinibacillus]|uniref:hypothetical protein n=1 Tax=Lysinibacillus TaxID=400634 RepID=UPI0025966CBD|nr:MULTISPECIES: hypothetical protein [Lysinibacillus]
MNMVIVFEEQVVKKTEQKLKQTLVKLKENVHLQQNFRELTDLSSTLERIKVILKDFEINKQNRDKRIAKRNELLEKHDKIYTELISEGFEDSWITTIVKHEMKNLKKVIKEAREEAYKEYFGEVEIEDDDLMDDRFDLVLQQIQQAKNKYIKGN